MQSFHALSSHDLREALGNRPGPLPPRGKGRTKEDSENWVTWHLLAAIAESELLEYPLCVEPGDRPDLVLSSRIGKTGIEITNAEYEGWARVEAELERIENPEEVVSVPQIRIGDKKLSKEEVTNLARNQAQSQNKPHMGDSIERNWIEAMMYFAKHKARKLASPGFAVHDRNWLLIYDCWTPNLGAHGCHKLGKQLAQQLFNREWQNPFEKILILKGNGETVWEFSRNAEFTKLHGPTQSS